MKKILITGAGSYIGTSFENYINTNFPDKYTVDTVDMIGNGWKEKDFSPYDAVFHVAGIHHCGGMMLASCTAYHNSLRQSFLRFFVFLLKKRRFTIRYTVGVSPFAACSRHFSGVNGI